VFEKQINAQVQALTSLANVSHVLIRRDLFHYALDAAVFTILIYPSVHTLLILFSLKLKSRVLFPVA
jgi:hypothetical protein